MTSENAGINVSKILAGLKDFQRQTVDYIFRRMYQDEDLVHRFLLADEVGLGKTLVARGVIAKAIEHLKSQGVKRIDIVYVCSNLDIARQNISRLNVTGSDDFVLSSRITLLPQEVSDLKGRSLNFVSFTPSTSFDLKSALGITRERALLYMLLHRAWGLKGTGPRNLLQGYAGRESFWSAVNEIEQGGELDAELSNAFLETLHRVCERDQASGVKDMKVRFLELCDRFARAHEVTDEDRDEQKELIGTLRSLLAVTCLQALEPDLIILDEFQRFKNLLVGNDDAGQLARRLFNFADEHTRARVLLLSATPYKMYTLSDESEQDDHYKDFLSTVRFLQDNQDESAKLQDLLKEFGQELLRIGDGSTGRVLEIKADIETRLRKVMVRTERLAATTNRDGMLAELQTPGLGPQFCDLQGYVGLQGVGSILDSGDTLELWKSAPYLLNFMDSYQLKESFKENAKGTDLSLKLRKSLLDAEGMLLPWGDIKKYGKVDPANARLRALVRDTVELGTWRLLWLPPTLPQYGLGGPFAEPGSRNFTKRLVFSSWRVVPKVIATLLSYEAERRAFHSFDQKTVNTAEERRRKRGLLRFARTEGRLTGMPLFLLLYPSVKFAQLWDTYQDVLRVTAGETLPTIDQVLNHFERKFDDLMPTLGLKYDTSGPSDDRWYWVVPIVADVCSKVYPEEVREWFQETGLDSLWRGENSAEGDEEGSNWSEHLDNIRETINSIRENSFALGPPPADLSRVLAKACVGSPAVAALRAISSVIGDPTCFGSSEARLAAAQIGWAMLSLFNLPESMALLRGMNSEEPYWLRVLEYSVDGGLQAVFDEYVHILLESEGLSDKDPSEKAEGLAKAFMAPLGLRTVSLGVDRIEVSPDTRTIQFEPREMRARFALRFGQGKEKAEAGAEPTREDYVRRAFNSPFWPFVLATTSVGQEGLDFHQYCHAVVHWNLPSNPVDLEQREGRVHRYKGHAVRKNLVKKFGGEVLRNDHTAAWNQLFELGSREQADTKGGLLPFWIYPLEHGAQVERHVYATPLSRESVRIEKLKQALTLYRMVFGQPRQDDLIEYLLKNTPPDIMERLCKELRIDLSPMPGFLANLPSPSP